MNSRSIPPPTNIAPHKSEQSISELSIDSRALPALEPNFPRDNYKDLNKKHLRLIQLYKNLEEKKSQSRSNGYYSVFLSILNTNNNASKGNSEPEYSYRQVYIRVNNQQQATTGNKDQFIMYSIQTGEQEMVYAGFLPKNKELKNAITRSLFHRFNTAGFQAGVDTLAIQSKKSNTSKNPTIAGNCLNDPPENCMMVFVPFVGYFPTCNVVCEQTQGGDGGSNNGGDTDSSSGSDSGSTSGSEGGDSKGGGGGGSNGGNQGGGCSVRDGNTCSNDAPTNDEDDEQTSDPDSCNTGDPVIDDPDIQQAFEQLWEESNFGSIENPNPEKERVEKGGFIVPDGRGGHVFQPMPSHLINEEETGPCRIRFSIPSGLPAGAIYVHTHPYKKNQLQNHCIPGKTLKYKNEVGVKDRKALESMGLDRGIILDADKIISYTPNKSQGPTLINRCGY